MEPNELTPNDNTGGAPVPEPTPEPIAPAPIMPEPTPEPTPEPAAPVVPETYADFSMPEGFTMDTELLAEFLPLAKEAGLTQEAAQKSIDLYTKGLSTLIQKQAQHRDASYAEVMESIKAATPATEKFDQNIGRINAVMNKFGGERFSDVVHQAAAQLAGADKALAQRFYAGFDKLARAAGVDERLIGGGGSSTNQRAADILFDKGEK